ncbi:uncharacterized protein LOC113310867 isoform X1 [Papaver somniferum]|uniref:uncharacterized protein LOC113310867 isoform X1 n=1 Tax=Papaver somniferum TaxID=3469 RepID=UPI000E6FD482|nr:uncharacterized protein LOC113310867 isoform X1 [Papaver somniferum]
MKNVERTGEVKSLAKTTASKRRKMVNEGDQFVDETSNEPDTSDSCDSDKIVGVASATFETKMKNVERTGEVKSLTKTTASKRRKMVNEGDQLVDETSNEPDTSDSCDSDTIVGGASATFGTKRKYVVRTGELKSLTKTTASKRRKMVKDGDQFVDETSNESATSDNCDSDGSVEVGSSKIGTKRKNFERKKGSGDWACLEERPSQHGSPSHAHPGMSKKTFVNLVSDSDDAGDSLNESEDSDCFIDSKNSLGDLMDMSALKNLNMNNDEMKWKSQADMLSSFEEDTEICMKAVCALYRQVISENEISPKGLVFDEDTHRYIKNSAHFSTISNSIILKTA